MGFIDLRSGTDRYVLLLENPAGVYRDNLEGSVRQRVDTQIDQFLTNTPESALEAEDKFPDPLRQLKDRGANVRGLGTWCQGEGYDLLVVQIVFDKQDEDRVYQQLDPFRERGRKLQERFGELDQEEIATKAEGWDQDEELLLFHP